MKLNPKCDDIAEFIKDHIEAVLVDIEGTTTPISFVTEVLFPYVKANVKDYLQTKWSEDIVQDDVEALRKLAEKDLEDGVSDVPNIEQGNEKSVIKSVVDNVLWQMSQDRKSTALKQLQGHMWKSAYEDGTIKGVVYDDVPNTLKQFVEDGKKIYVYSSGSVAAQKLLFGHSDHGDLCNIFSGYFDTKIGNKRESPSYKAIASSIKVCPENILFLTDVYAEAKAASEANINACILLRPGNKPLTTQESGEFLDVRSFDELLCDNEPEEKRQKVK